MSEDTRTLWVGNLSEEVTEDLIYELFLQTGPIERLVLPSEGEGDQKKHKGHAYVVFKHPETVQYAAQIMDGSSLFSHKLTMKARSLPITYKATTPGSGNKGRFDNNRPGFNKASTWHGQSESSVRGRGGFRNQGGGSSYSQNTGYNTNFNNYNNQVNSGYWAGEQQTGTDTQATSYNTTDGSLEDKRQRLLQKQTIALEAHRQLQQGVMSMASQVLGMVQQSQQQGTWATGSYSTDTWSMASTDTSSAYQSYPTDQYGNWYQQQQ